MIEEIRAPSCIEDGSATNLSFLELPQGFSGLIQDIVGIHGTVLMKRKSPSTSYPWTIRQHEVVRACSGNGLANLDNAAGEYRPGGLRFTSMSAADATRLFVTATGIGISRKINSSALCVFWNSLPGRFQRSLRAIKACRRAWVWPSSLVTHRRTASRQPIAWNSKENEVHTITVTPSRGGMG